MKKYSLLICTTLLFNFVFSQDTGWILLGTAGLIVTGIALQTGEANADFNFTGTGIAIAGAVVSLFSIRFLKKAVEYRNEANASISFKYEPLTRLNDTGNYPQKNSGIRHKLIPAVSILFNL